MKEILNRIKTFLKEKKLTNRSFAESLDVNEKTLGNKLRGARDLDIDDLVLILDAYPDLSAEWLMRGNGTMLHIEEHNNVAWMLDDAMKNSTFLDDRLDQVIEKKIEEKVNEYINKKQGGIV